MDKRIELAKSWFVLAEIIIILAGFFFTTSGITSNLFVQSQNKITQNYEDLYVHNTTSSNLMLTEFYLTKIKFYANESKAYNNFFILTIVLAIILSIISFLFWGKGRKELKKISIIRI